MGNDSPTARTEPVLLPLHRPAQLWDPAMQPYGSTASYHPGSVFNGHTILLDTHPGMEVGPPTQYRLGDEGNTSVQVPRRRKSPARPGIPRKRKAPTMREKDWEPVKDRLIELHNTQDIPLPEAKKKIEEEFRHRGFTATLRQFRTQISKWHLDKNVKRKEMETIVRKRQKRRLIERDKGELVFKIRGEVVPSNKIDRWMGRNRVLGDLPYDPISPTSTPSALSTRTVSERGSPTPGLSTDFQVSLPSSNLLWRPWTGILPIFQLEEFIMIALGSSNIFDEALYHPQSISTLLITTPQSLQDIFFKYLLPNSGIYATFPGTAMVHDPFSCEGILPLLYLISNSFSAETHKGRIYQLARSMLISNTKYFRSSGCYSVHALLQNLFKLAVEAEDLPVVKSLIEAGADVNAINFRVSTQDDIIRTIECPIPLTPLQFACLVGSAPLIQELLDAGSKIDAPEPGWKCSAILLAIYGSWKDLRGKDFREPLKQKWRDQESLLNIVRQLRMRGANVNVGPIDTNEIEMVKNWRERQGHLFSDILRYRHSPLTLASKYNYEKIVDYLISEGANPRYLVNGTSSALREYFVNRYWNKTPGEPEPSTVPRSLVHAGVNLNDHNSCDVDKRAYYRLKALFEYNECDRLFGDMESLSIVDFAICTESSDLLDDLLFHGARTTQYTLGIALKEGNFEIFRRLIAENAEIPEWALTFHDEEDVLLYSDTLYTEYAEGLKHIHQRLLFWAAIRFGATQELGNLIRFNSPSICFPDEWYRGIGFTTALEGCCKDGHFETLQFLLAGENMSKPPPCADYGSSVYLSIYYGHMNLLELLIESNADVDRPLKSKNPMWLAISKGYPETVRKLVRSSTRLKKQLFCKWPNSCVNPLISAIWSNNPAIIEELLVEYINIHGLQRESIPFFYNTCSSCNPVTAAILKRNWTLVDRLLYVHANVNDTCDVEPYSRYHRFHSPLSAAIRQNNFTLVKSLLAAGAEVYDEAALKAALDNDDLWELFFAEILKSAKLRPQSETEKFSHIALADTIRRADRPKVLLILGNELVDLKVSGSNEALNAALDLQPKSRPAMLKLLLSMDADPNSFVAERKPALLKAIERNDPECTMVLLEAGAAANPSDSDYSPAQLGAYSEDPEFLKTLLTYGCNANAIGFSKDDCTTRSHTALQIATQNSNIEMVNILLEHDADPNFVPEYYQHTVLQIASRERAWSIVEILLAHGGADVNSPPAPEFGATALQYAAINGCVGIAQVLVEKGALINAPPAIHDGRTALEGAAEYGRIDMVQFLINEGADLSETGNGQYERALKRALENGHCAVYKLLQSYSPC